MGLKTLAAVVPAFGLGLTGPAWAQERLGVAEPWQLGLQEQATPVMSQMSDFHNLLLIIITGITLFVLGLLVYVMWRFNAKKNPTPSKTAHHTMLEVVWTIVPVLILLVIAVPSFRLLYFMDRTENPEMTVVVRGYQWYWSYEYPDQQIPEYTSYMIPDEEIGPGQLRLLSVDNPMVVPVDTDVQILVTAGDVLHSWAVPSFGMKRDAVPGRMNETWIRVDEEGTYYGQCSEICGVGHAFMPIEVKAVSREAFDDWVMEQTADLDLDEPPVLLTRDHQDTTTEAGAAEQAALTDGTVE